MAPEQIVGDAVHARTDIFALGVVLYEAVAGKHAFRGESASAIAASILKDEPVPLGELAPEFPTRVAHVVETCTAKEPEARWQSAIDFARELRWATSGDAPAATTGKQRRGWRLPLWAAALFGTLLLGTLWLRPEKAVLDVRAISLGPPAGTYFGGLSPALSPDGRRFAFKAGRYEPVTERLGRLGPNLVLVGDRCGDRHLVLGEWCRETLRRDVLS